MLQLIINGENAILSKDMQVTLERYNPLLDVGVIRASKVMNFNLPYCAENNKILGYYGHMGVAFKPQLYECEILFDGQLIEKGFLQVKRFVGDFFEVVFTQLFDTLFDDLQNKTLNNIDFSTSAIVSKDNIAAAADHLVDPFCFPMIYNTGFYGGEQGAYNGYMNYYVANAYEGNTFVPMVFLRYVFTRVSQLTGVQFEGDFIDDPHMQRLFFFNLKALDGVFTINIKDHLPSITIPELIKGLKNLFNLVVYIDTRSKVIRLDYARDVFKSAVVEDWSRKFGELRQKMPLTESRTELNFTLDPNDGLQKNIPSEVDGYEGVLSYENEGVHERSTIFSTLVVQNGVPACDQIGISDFNRQDASDFAPRLLFWHGIVSGLPYSYPHYSDTRLEWNGFTGLYNKFWKEYVAWRKNTYTLQERANLTAYDVARLDFHRRKGELMKVHIQGQNYIVADQLIGLPVKEAPVVTLWKC